MKVFISWSGNSSQKIAEVLTNWIPKVLQSAKPYFSPSDIEKGTKWESEITKNLNECSIGIICVTRDNTNKPWILFEAGALSNKLEKSRVCPLLFGISNSDLTGPLATFQTTVFQKDEFKKLINSINKQLEENKVGEKVLDEVFEMFFPSLEESIGKILKDSKMDQSDEKEKRSDRDLLEEILELTRRQYSRPKKSRFVDYDINKEFEEISDKELNYINDSIMRYMKENNFRLKEYDLLDLNEVFLSLKADERIKEAAGSPANLRKIISDFITQ